METKSTRAFCISVFNAWQATNKQQKTTGKEKGKKFKLVLANKFTISSLVIILWSSASSDQKAYTDWKRCKFVSRY